MSEEHEIVCYKCPICQKLLEFSMVTAVDDDPMFGNKSVLWCKDCNIKVEVYDENYKSKGV